MDSSFEGYRREDDVRAVSLLASEEPDRVDIVAIDPPSRFGERIGVASTPEIAYAYARRNGVTVIGVPRTLRASPISLGSVRVRIRAALSEGSLGTLEERLDYEENEPKIKTLLGE